MKPFQFDCLRRPHGYELGRQVHSCPFDSLIPVIKDRTVPRLFESRKRILVTGGAGFLGSHLIDRLLESGHEVLCVDNLFTGTKRNLEHLHAEPRFEFIRHDVTFPLYVEADEIYNLACPASPIHYQHDPVQTTKTSVHGAINMLGLAKRLSAAFFRRQPVKFMAIRRFIRRPKLIGVTSTLLALALAMTKANAVPRPCSSTITDNTVLKSKWLGFSILTARACIRPTDGWFPISLCRRSGVSRLRFMEMENRPAHSATWTT